MVEEPQHDLLLKIRELESRLGKMRFSRVTTRVYDNTRHESLNELNRNIIIEDFAAWAGGVAQR